MANTSIVPAKTANVSSGYNFKKGKPMPAPGVSTDLKSAAPDMLQWLKAQLDPFDLKNPGLSRAIERTQQIYFERSDDCPSTHHLAFDMGLAWQFYDGTISKLPGEIVWTKNGASPLGGMSCWVAFLPARKVGIAVLTNMDGQTMKPGSLGTDILVKQLGLSS
jgi:CubicO group peptidase (beta-lactamase class C family)